MSEEPARRIKGSNIADLVGMTTKIAASLRAYQLS
jgi:hypothetical protein